MSFANFISNVRRDRKDGNLGPRRFETRLYPRLEKQTSDLYIVARRGDRLDLLSQKFYGTPIYWKIIAQANELGKNSFAVPEGTRLRIPVIPEEADRLYNKYNSER